MQSKSSRKDFLYSLTSSQRLAFLEEEKSQKQIQEQESLKAYATGSPLVFDLSFVNVMSSSEINSMINQIRLAVGYLRKQNMQFFKLICCNATKEVKETFRKKGSSSWKLDVFEEEICGLDIARNREIVMLSPDAEEVLDDIDIHNSVYVIGGIVDKTVKSRETFNKAQEMNWKCKKLPIKETIWLRVNPYKMKKVLNINTVVEILQLKASGCDWEEALCKAIPQRWQKHGSSDGLIHES